LARGGGIEEAARSRLGEAVAAIDTTLTAQTTAQTAEANAWAVVVAEDIKSDLGIANVRDEMWHAIGRQRGNQYLDQIFPDGVATYTDGDRRSQPLLMRLLVSRILAGSAPQWTKEMR